MNFNLNRIMADELNKLAARLEKPNLTPLELAEIRGQMRLLNKLMQKAHNPDWETKIRAANDRANEEVEGRL